MKYLILFITSIILSSCGPKLSSVPQIPSTPITITPAPNSPISTTASTTPQSGVVNFAYQNSQIQIETPLPNAKLSQTDSQNFGFATPEKNIEVKYKVLQNGLKEDIILNQAPTSNQFISHLKITNADVYLNNDNIFVFYDSKTNNYLFRFQKPFAIDAAGNRTQLVTYQLFQNGKALTINPRLDKNNMVTVSFSNQPTKLGTGDNYSLQITLDANWLADPKRVYPITIDPTIITDTYADTTKINTGASTNYTVTGGQLTISSSGGCWGTAGSCNATCLVTNQVTSTENMYSNYIDPSGCTGPVGTTQYITLCAGNGTGNCYIKGSTADCSCDYTDSNCVYGPFAISLGTQCTWIAGTYSTLATIQSANLLTGYTGIDSITTFSYSLSTLPPNTQAGVNYSQDASTWKNSAGSVGNTDTLSVGNSTPIDISGLGWTGAYFYYKLVFRSNGTATPVMNDVSVSYNTNTVQNSFQMQGVQLQGIKIQ